MTGIYAILNTFNDKFYIGSAVNLKERWWQHKTRLNIGDHHNKHLNNAWKKYGRDVFIFVVLEYCSIDELFVKEQYWIDKTKVCEIGYNKRIDAVSNRGTKRTEESKLRSSLAQKGKKLSPKHIKSLIGRKFKLTEETKSKMKIAAKIRVNNPNVAKGLEIGRKKRHKSFELNNDPIMIC